MTRIDVLMPAAGHDYAPVAAEYLAPYRTAFAERGLELVPIPWTTVAPAEGHPSKCYFDGTQVGAASDKNDSSVPPITAPASAGATPAATLAFFAWGYHHDLARWDALLAAWPADRLLLNPPGLLRWNTRKTYLTELAAAGLPVVPSRFGPADADSVAAAFAAFECDELVVKPQVSAGAWLTQRLRPGDVVEPISEAILQPFLPAVGGEGELSFLFVDGAFSHAVRKVAAAGDFRIQPQFGGTLTAFTPVPEDRALAERIVIALPAEPLYARVDLIRLPDGSLALMELEAIEPDLYVAQEPALPGRLADALIARLG